MREECDDPYKMLACCLIAYLRRADIERLLHDNEYLERLVKKEARQLDLAGWFIDTIVEEMLENKARMKLMAELDKLGHALYLNIDKVRLRRELKDNYRKYFGIDLTDIK